MKREVYNKLFNHVYGVSTLVFLSIAFILFMTKKYDLGIETFLYVFIASGIITWSIIAFIRLINKVDEHTEEFQKLSLIARIPKVQLFSLLNLFLSGLAFVIIFITEYVDSSLNTILFLILYTIVLVILLWGLKKISFCREIWILIISIPMFVLILCSYLYCIHLILNNKEENYQEEDIATITEVDSLTIICQDTLESVEPILSNPNEQLDSLSTNINRWFAEQTDETALKAKIFRFIKEYSITYDSICCVLKEVNTDSTNYQISYDSLFRCVSSKNDSVRTNTNMYCHLYWLFAHQEEFTKSINYFQEKIINDSLFTNKDIRHIFETLDWTFRDITTSSLQDSCILESIFQCTETNGIHHKNLLKYIHSDYLKYLIQYTSEKDFYLWAYTFWARREHSIVTTEQARMLVDAYLSTYPNEDYTEESVNENEKILQNIRWGGKEFLLKFIKWYNDSYRTYQVLHIIEYNTDGDAIKINKEEYENYINILFQSNYLSSDYIKRLKKRPYLQFPNIKDDNKRAGRKTWFKKDPIFYKSESNILFNTLSNLSVTYNNIRFINLEKKEIVFYVSGMNITLKQLPDGWKVYDIK